MEIKQSERRSEQRKITDLYYSVEFSIKGLDYLYQFKLRYITKWSVHNGKGRFTDPAAYKSC